jgi:predicted short-subunit dehydrogenase-like oxidoreductase (DUF2520 family)
MRVVIIGSGNVATVMGEKIAHAGHHMMQVISRNAEHAGYLARKLDCAHSSNLGQIERHADFYMIAVADDALQSIASSINLENKVIAHTAGSVSRNILQSSSLHFGVLYPLQTIRKEISEYLKIPLLIDGNSASALAIIEEMANTISDEVHRANDQQRQKLHIAATVINNFCNHLFTLTEEYCSRQKVDFQLLLPLILETAKRLQFFSAAEVQTGPARRYDTQTITSHLEQLADFPELKKIYEFFTASIQHKINER